MNADEFTKWKEEFKACLPMLAAELRKQPTHQETLKRWHHTLESVEYDDAVAVLHKIVAGEIERPWLDEFCGTVRKEAYKLKVIRDRIPQVTREPRYTCLKCRDSGWAKILKPRYLQWLREAEASRILKQDCAYIPCDCEKGQVKRWAGPRLGERDWHVLVTGNDAEDIAAAQRVLAERFGRMPQKQEMF